MSLRLPQLLAEARLRADKGINVLESEMLADKAASLGHHGRLVEQAMAAAQGVPGRARGAA